MSVEEICRGSEMDVGGWYANVGIPTWYMFVVAVAIVVVDGVAVAAEGRCRSANTRGFV